ncbi:chitinase [Cordyceps fumosorosea ARSEF 2679]|uniref:chitinase n=1 Tax=Cordyceps fumosorosea (strain ARSEF 2679) TaxID=1081104 RepID=A0A167RRI6_CORFA|nr:chitinase [Cordyceps fumosorosea ARSEF 2679]OAA58860.1 chitinase [Cordyceps fumosorosea ARSEF 2679]
MLGFLRKSIATVVALRAVATFATPISSEVGFPKRDGGYKNVVYFTNWGIYGRNYHVADLPAENITHLLYSFMNFDETGTVFSGDTYADLEKHYYNDSWNEPGNNVFGCVKQINLLKKEHRHIKVLLSIGGWTWSKNFAVVASSDTTRKAFAKSVVTFLKDWGLDGIDIDWEYPETEEDGQNMILLLQAIRDELDSYASRHAEGYHFLLSIAAPAGLNTIGLLKLPELGKVLDLVNLMAYDYAGSWSNTTGYNANVFPNANNTSATPFNTNDAVQAYKEGGVPAEKLVLGVPIYGRAFEQTEGIAKPFNGVGSGSWEAGVYDYKSLPSEGAIVKCDYIVMGCYCYNPKTKTLVSFDTPEMVEAKAAWLKQQGLGGIMVWEASGDKNNSESLIERGSTALGSLDRSQNCLSYPDSKFDNIRNSMA